MLVKENDYDRVGKGRQHQTTKIEPSSQKQKRLKASDIKVF